MEKFENESKLIDPSKEVHINMTLLAFEKTAEFVLSNPMKPGDFFRIQGTDGKDLIIHFK